MDPLHSHAEGPVCFTLIDWIFRVSCGWLALTVRHQSLALQGLRGHLVWDGRAGSVLTRGGGYPHETRKRLLIIESSYLKSVDADIQKSSGHIVLEFNGKQGRRHSKLSNQAAGGSLELNYEV